MPDNYKRTNIGFFGCCKEYVQGVPLWDVKQDAAPGGVKTAITVDTATGTGNHDTNHAGVEDDFFNDDHYAYCYSGANVGEMRKITDYAEAANVATITTDAFTANITAADRFFIVAPLPASNIDMKIDPAEDLPRDAFHRQTLDPPSSLPGLSGGSVSFDCEIPALETPSVDGTAAEKDRFSALLSAIGTRVAKAGEDTTGTSSTTTSIDVTDASTFSVDDHVMIEGQVRRVTAVDTASTPDNITVEPPLSAAPGDAVLVSTPEQWRPADTGHQSLTFIHLMDDQLKSVHGCVGGFSGTWTFGANQKFSWSFDGDGYSIEDSVDVTGTLTQSSELTVPFTSGAAYVGTTAIGLNEVGIELGTGNEEIRDTIEGKAFRVVSRTSTLSVKFRNTVRTPVTSWLANKTQFRFLIQGGNTAGGCVAISANGQFESIDPSDVGQISYHDGKVRCVDDQTDADSAQKLQLLRF